MNCYELAIIMTLFCSEFCNMVRRIFICASQDVKRMGCGTKLPMSSVEVEGTAISLDTAED